MGRTKSDPLPDVFQKPVFIVGCARSGTSILGELVAQHPEVAYLFEAHGAWAAAGVGAKGSDRLTEAHASAEVARQVRGRLERRLLRSHETGSILVEKNPRNALRVPFLRSLFPEARFVHIVRDGRDVACSLVPGCGGDEWRHLKPPSWRELRAEYAGVRRTARVWLEVVEIALRDLEPLQHVTVRYEDLVAAPKRVSHEIFGFLDLRATPEIEQFYSKIDGRAEGAYEAAQQSKWTRRGHTARVGRWRENLTADEQRELECVLGPMLGRLGYDRNRA